MGGPFASLEDGENQVPASVKSRIDDKNILQLSN